MNIYTVEQDGQHAVTLAKAAEIIKKGWSRGAHARNADNKAVKLDDPSACKFCGVGAIAIARILLGHQFGATAYATRALGDKALSRWNDFDARDSDQVNQLLLNAAALAALEHRQEI